MNQNITYLMSGDAHAPYAVVSLYTLRRHYSGSITVYAFPESRDVMRRVCEDDRLKAKCVGWPPQRFRRNEQFINKIRLMQTLPAASLYLDADTVIAGSLDDLFDRLRDYSFVATQFNDWKSHQGLASNRIKWLLGQPGMDNELVQAAITGAYPSVNGGVFGCHPSSPVLRQWEQWTLCVPNLFIADEVCLHLMAAHYKSGRTYMIQTGGDFNCSPKYRPAYLAPEDVKIWHGHGDAFTRESKKGVDLWWPLYEECLRENVGGMAEWIGSIQHKCLNEMQALRGDQSDVKVCRDSL